MSYGVLIAGYNTSMVSKALFKTAKGKEPNTVNEAGGEAYKMEAKHALAQLAVTGCLGNTFYASAETQLNTVLDLLNSLEPTRDNMTFVAKLAAYSRHKGFMKDMPALIVAWMTKVKTPDGKFLTDTHNWARNILAFIFDEVIDNAYANEIIGAALQDAFEISLKNAPKLTGLSYVFVDVSGSMGYSVTSGYNSKTTFVDIAAMFASAIKKSNPEAVIVPFNDFVIDYKINSRDSSMTISSQLAALCTGGTRTSSCLEYLKKNKIKPDNIIFISDNMSWEDKIPANTIYQDVKTATSKLICIDIAPYTSTQFDYGKNVLHIGGFNDSVFAAIEAFLNGTTNFVEVIME